MGQEITSSDIINRNYKEAYGIIGHMRNYTDKASKKEHLNFSLLASAAEGVTGNLPNMMTEIWERIFMPVKKDFTPIPFMFRWM